MAKRRSVLILVLLVKSIVGWIESEWLCVSLEFPTFECDCRRPNWFHLDDCWTDPSCFELKRGQFGPQKRGPDGWQIRPRYPGHSLIADTRFGYPAFYVRDFLQGEEKFIRGYNLTVYELFKKLPVRNHLSPYLLFFKPTFCGDGILCPRMIEDLINKRTDIIWVGHDLGGMKLGHPGYTVPGVTIPGELGSTITYAWRYRGKPKYPHKHYLTFQGKCPSRKHAAQWHMNYSVRGELNRLFNKVSEDNVGSEPREGLPSAVVRYVCSDRQKGRVSSDEEVNRHYREILDTDYALVPRGDERWSFRFLEAVGAGAVPVVVADGLTLPYDNLINWEEIVVRVPERALLEMSDYRDLLSLLPGPEELKVRYEAIRMVNARYFADGRTLEWAFELAVTRYIETNQRAKWRPFT